MIGEQNGWRRAIAYLSFYLIALQQAAGGAEWKGIRDGVVYVRSSKPTKVQISWKAVWNARNQQKTLYWQAPDGRVLERVRISGDAKTGEKTIETHKGAGDYSLHIPGRTYREYSVITPNNTKSVLKPAKHYMSLRVEKGDRFFFLISDTSKFSFRAKYYQNGVKKITVIDPGGKKTEMTLTKYEKRDYTKSDYIDFLNPKPGVWRWEAAEPGKVSAWLDDTENIFALDSLSCFIPKSEKQHVSLTINSAVKGPMFRIGATMPAVKAPVTKLRALTQLHSSIASMYAIPKRCIAKDGSVAASCDYYKQYNAIGVQQFATVFKGDAYTDSASAKNFAAFMQTYIRRQSERAEWSKHYFSIFDEPNMRFKSSAEFKRYFKRLVPCIDSIRASDSTMKCMIPESAGMFANPLSSDGFRRKGKDWLKPLLEDHWSHIDAISWHEWNVRHLIAAESISETIEQVWQLMQHARPEGALPKELCITQTNISPGYGISPYQSHSFYGALWISSIVAHAASTGKLSQLIWLPGVDGFFPKGLFELKKGKRVSIRPVGRAVGFINDAQKENALEVTSSSIECNAFAMTNQFKDSVNIIVANTTQRPKTIDIATTGFNWDADSLDRTVFMLDSTGVVQEVENVREQVHGKVSFSLATTHAALYRISLSVVPSKKRNKVR